MDFSKTVIFGDPTHLFKSRSGQTRIRIVIDSGEAGPLGRVFREDVVKRETEQGTETSAVSSGEWAAPKARARRAPGAVLPASKRRRSSSALSRVSGGTMMWMAAPEDSMPIYFARFWIRDP
jgi:hypothetical protein